MNNQQFERGNGFLPYRNNMQEKGAVGLTYINAGNGNEVNPPLYILNVYNGIEVDRTIYMGKCIFNGIRPVVN